MRDVSMCPTSNFAQILATSLDIGFYENRDVIYSTVHIVKMKGLVCQHIEPPSGSAFIHEHVVRKVTGSVKTKPNHSLTHHIPYNH